MRSLTRRLVLAAALLLTPALARADVFDVPAGYFTGPTRSWDFSGCANGMVGWNPSAYTPINGSAFCVQGRATFGMRVGGTYDLIYALSAAPTPLAVAYGSTYSFTSDYSGATYIYGSGCTVACTGGGGLVPRDIGAFHGYGVEQFGLYGTLPNFDPAVVAPTYLAYSTYAHVAGFPYPYTDNAVAVEIRTFTATPEPSTLGLTIGGLAVLGASVRRRRPA